LDLVDKDTPTCFQELDCARIFWLTLKFSFRIHPLSVARYKPTNSSSTTVANDNDRLIDNPLVEHGAKPFDQLEPTYGSVTMCVASAVRRPRLMNDERIG
jgi:hypothetical protein